MITGITERRKSSLKGVRELREVSQRAGDSMTHTVTCQVRSDSSNVYLLFSFSISKSKKSARLAPTKRAQ